MDRAELQRHFEQARSIVNCSKSDFVHTSR